MAVLAATALALPSFGCTLLTGPQTEPSVVAAQPAESETEFPNLGSVPDEPPVVTPRGERRALLEQLQSDREAAGVSGSASVGAAPEGGSE